MEVQAHTHTERKNGHINKQNLMRKIISFMHISLDGFVAGPNGEMKVSKLMNKFLIMSVNGVFIVPRWRGPDGQYFKLSSGGGLGVALICPPLICKYTYIEVLPPSR